MRTLRPLALGAVVAALVGPLPPALAGGAHAAAPCKGSALSGSFRAVPGSAGAGNIVYRLRVRNISSVACFVTGIPQLGLLDAHHVPLPTNARFGGPAGALAAVVVRLARGRFASLTARFSPDVPGPAEPVSGAPCERTATTLRVTPSGGGSVVVPITPATPVCEHGGMSLTVFTAA